MWAQFMPGLPVFMCLFHAQWFCETYSCIPCFIYSSALIVVPKYFMTPMTDVLNVNSLSLALFPFQFPHTHLVLQLNWNTLPFQYTALLSHFHFIILVVSCSCNALPPIFTSCHLWISSSNAATFMKASAKIYSSSSQLFNILCNVLVALITSP